MKPTDTTEADIQKALDQHVLPTGQEMNAWIAEHVYNWKRWKFTRTDGSTFVQFAAPEFEQSHYIRSKNPVSVSSGGEENAPHYSTDLAAAYEAEGRVPEELRGQYIYELRQILDAVTPGNVVWKFRRATPAQICEAIYRAMEARNA